MKTLVNTPLAFYAMATLIISSSLVNGSPHRWTNGYGGQYRYYPQSTYQRYNQQNIGVSQENVEWVCTSPKTKDMMIIASESVPVRSNPNEQPKQWSQPNQPNQPLNNEPIYIQPNNPPLRQPTQNEQLYPVNPVYQTTQAPNNFVIVERTTRKQEPIQEPINSNGDGLIDIRVGP